MPPYALLAFISAIGYSLGGLFNKRAMEEGAGLLRVNAVSIWAAAAVVLPFLFAYDTPIPWDVWWQPLTAGLCFLSGQVFFILALKTGDISLVAPVAGAKPIINALLVAGLVGIRVPAATWAASLLTAVALVILRTPNTSTSHSFLRTALITLTSATSFALCDTCFQEWAASWGVLRFSALAFSFASLGAVGLLPFVSKPWKDVPRRARRNMLIGCAISAVPGFCMGLALGRYGHAAEVNVIYGTRAVISIAAARFLGRWIGSREQHVSRTVLIRRMIGTAILMAAVGLVLFGSR